MKLTKTPFSSVVMIRLFGRWDFIVGLIDNKKMIETAEGGEVVRENYEVNYSDEKTDISGTNKR